MDIVRLRFLLFHSRNGLLSEHERMELEEWYESVRDPGLVMELSEIEKRELKERMRTRIYKVIEEKSNSGLPPGSVRTFPRYLVWAAASFVLLLAGLAFQLFVSHSEEPSQIAVTGAAERKHLTLADGSEVWLGPTSTLRFPSVFKGGVRKISLSGEAFFEVKPDKSRPFIVQTDTIATTVLGTSFNIRSHPSESEVKVTVVTGRVSVGYQGGTQSLVADHQQGTISKISPGAVSVVEYRLAEEEFLARRQGIYQYDGVPVGRVLEDVERLWGQKIEVEGDIGSCSYFGSFSLDYSIEDLLEEICYVMKGKLSKSESGFRIKGAGCRR